MKQVLIFAGTEEGRTLAEFLTKQRIAVTICIATEYGEQMLFPSDCLTVIRGRLSEEQMEALIQSNDFLCVIDATHPYASDVTDNILRAANKSNLKYYRVIRDGSRDESVVRVASYEDAVSYLAETEGSILIVTGSKRADVFAELPNYQDRCHLRILPVAEGLRHCIDAGFLPKNIICMQGPFTKAMNAATIRQIGARYLVTKDSGKVGGVDEKLAAAKETGTTVVMIGRPKEETGFSPAQMMTELCALFGFDMEEESNGLLRFPMFVDISSETAVVIGGGTIATRRVKTLLRFGCEIRVVATNLSAELRTLCGTYKRLRCFERSYQNGDCDGAYLAVAATDERALNHEIYETCRQNGCLCSVADSKEECDFYFPAVIPFQQGIIALAGTGNEHGETKRMADEIRRMVASQKKTKES